MSNEDQSTKELIREYLLDEGLLRKRLPPKKLDFGFQFTFPPGSQPSGQPIGKNMAVFKPKNQGFIIIEIGTQISEIHQKALNSLKKERKMKFFMDLRKFFLIKNVYFGFDTENFRYKISEQIFLEKDKRVSKNAFFKAVRKIFNCAIYSNILLGEYCSGKVSPEDISKPDEFSPGFSLYT
jgi:hypothetical protein